MNFWRKLTRFMGVFGRTPRRRRARALFVGLNNAGKSTLLYRLKTDRQQNVSRKLIAPTIGFTTDTFLCEYRLSRGSGSGRFTPRPPSQVRMQDSAMDAIAQGGRSRGGGPENNAHGSGSSRVLFFFTLLKYYVHIYILPEFDSQQFFHF